MILDNGINGLAVLFAGALLLTPLAAQDVQVTAADPASAPQGAINLDVKISGKGFKPGAQSRFYVTGTVNPGGVKVNSTTYVSPSRLISNIDVSDTAILANYDIEVTLSSGRTGKGIEKFTVIAKGANACVLDPVDTGHFTLAGTLNTVNGSAPAYTNGFGTAVRARKVTLGGRTVLVVAVGSGGSGKMQVFFLDPGTGEILDGQPMGANTAPQPHLTMTINPTQTAGVRRIETGDVNSDGVPDFVIASWNTDMAYAFVSSVSSSGVLSYSDGIPLVPTDPGNPFDYYGRSVAVGDLDLSYPGLEVAVVCQDGKKVSPKVFLFHWNGSSSSFSQYQVIPIMASGVAIGDVAGDSNEDLLVATSTGLYVFPGLPAAGNSFVLGPGEGFADTAVANVDGGLHDDAIGTTQVFSGLVSVGQTPSIVLTPIDWIGGWGSAPRLGDINNDGLADLVSGVVTAPANAACPPAGDTDTVGAAYVFLTNAASSPWQPTRYVVRPPSLDPDFDGYGWSVEAADGTRLFMVGANGRDVGGVTGAGQVFVYRVPEWLP